MESFSTRDGRTLTYRLEGSGPLLVCHPGGPGFDSGYLRELAGLGATRTLLLLNPRGTNASDPPEDSKAYRIEDYVADVEELRDHLGREQLDLLGHSHGGVVAMAWAAAHPSQVRVLVLVSTLARFRDKQVAAMEAGMLRRKDEPWYPDARAASDLEQTGDFDEAQLPGLMQRMMPFYVAQLGETEREYLGFVESLPINHDALKLWDSEIQTSFDLIPALVQIGAPTLVISSDLDFITGPVCASEIADAIPGSELVILEGCGHFLIVEAADRFRDVVEAFLTRASS